SAAAATGPPTMLGPRRPRRGSCVMCVLAYQPCGACAGGRVRSKGRATDLERRAAQEPDHSRRQGGISVVGARANHARAQHPGLVWSVENGGGVKSLALAGIETVR